MAVLEVGCGRAEVLTGFKSLGLRCHGSDISEYADECCAREDIPYRRWDLLSETTPWPESSFDIVYSKSVLEHFHDGLGVISRQISCLKPGGLLLVLTPDWESNIKIFYHDFSHVQPYSTVSLVSLLEVSGLDDVNARRFRQLPITWRFPPADLLSRVIAPFVIARPKNKFLRWSRELMIAGSGRRPM